MAVKRMGMLEVRVGKMQTLTVKMETAALIGKGRNRGDGKSLAQPGRKQATATGDFDVHISYL